MTIHGVSFIVAYTSRSTVGAVKGIGACLPRRIGHGTNRAQDLSSYVFRWKELADKKDSCSAPFCPYFPGVLLLRSLRKRGVNWGATMEGGSSKSTPTE